MFTLEENPDMYAAAGLPLHVPTSKPVDLDVTVQRVMSSVGDMKGANVNIKVVLVSGNTKYNYEFLVQMLWLDIFI
jgi:hypothetical protein